MADILVFDPASEFELIEEIDFEEEVQRPEELRFFTLDEQLLDYFDKVLPKKKHITKFEYEAIAKDIDRVRELYTKLITITDTDYRVDLDRKDISVPWVLPIYEPFSLKSYSYDQEWMPLFERGARTQPNFYPRMLSAMPRPYRTTSSSGVPLVRTQVVVDENGNNAIHAQGLYERTKRALHEDGTFDIVNIPMTNTEDDIRIRGYFLKDRILDIPNPLANHPFFETNRETKILTEEPLKDVFPTIEAILNHGVPTTSDPYVEGLKYLKVYDVKLTQIPWNLWKDRFPPAEMVSVSQPVQSISFSGQTEHSIPAKSLQEGYVLPWSPGIEPRLWLMKQEDGGRYVIKMLLSKAGDAGRVPPDTPGEKPSAQFPKSSPDECFVDGDFDTFLNSGVYRAPVWKDFSDAWDKKKSLPSGVCIPASYISQERKSSRFVGRSAWVDSTEFDILKEHQKLLKLLQHRPMREITQKFEKHVAKQESDLRKQVRAILGDTMRTPEDKADAIGKIVRELPPTEDVYVDSTSSFVVCEHTLAQLRGDMEDDRLAYYEKWTSIDGGFRACKFCGEQVNADVFVAQDDFDDAGRVIVSHEVLPTSVYHGESHVASFTNSLRELQKVFLLDNAGESILYLLLSVLQVLPAESQVLPILENIRVLTSVVRANKKIQKTDKDRIEGILGLAGSVVLLQVHNPFLIPRRSFGSKVLKLTGFPRDSVDPDDSPILDTLISVLRSTFESMPSTLKGPITAILRTILTTPKKVRSEAVVYVKQAAAKFQTLLQSAKDRYVSPADTGSPNVIQLPMIPVSKQVFGTSERLGAEETIGQCNVARPKAVFVAKLPPNIVQEQLDLWKAIKPSPSAQQIVPVLEKTLIVDVEQKELRRRVTLGVPKDFKLEKMDVFLRSDTDATAFLLFLSRVLDILSKEAFSLDTIQKYRTVLVYLDNHIDKSILRDAARGFIYELLNEVVSSSNKTGLVQAIRDAVQKDIVMNMLLLKKEDAETQNNDLRAQEREVFKRRMRQMNDTEREITKMLLDIGIASTIISNEDREIFAREYNYQDPEADYEKAATEMDGDRPEEGFGTPFDTVDNGDVPLTDDGLERPYDRGDYGERMERQFSEYETISAFNFEESDGV
jgi:hypothetical protein